MGSSCFPSWSWLGWIGHAAYPWVIEREYFMATKNSPLVWRNANQSRPDPLWFTYEDLCLPQTKERERLLGMMRRETDDHLGLRKSCMLARIRKDVADLP